MWTQRAAYVTALLWVTMAAGCRQGNPPTSVVDQATGSSLARAGALSVADFRFSGWHDRSFHYLPTLSVSAPAAGPPVFVQRVDFTDEEAGAPRLLRGVRYDPARRVEPGSTIKLVPAGAANPTEIVSLRAITSISAIVFYTDNEGQTGVISTAVRVQFVPLEVERR